MLQAAEPKIQRMEYRTARMLPLGSVESKPLFPMASLEMQPRADDNKEELLRLASRIEELEQQLTEQAQQFITQRELARNEGFEAGRNSEAVLRASALDKIANSLGGSLNDFCNTRDRYLMRVEREVVQLSLSIAARILHRETQMDPLLLSGAVRIALGQLSETTEVRLRVPSTEFELWNEMVQLMPGLPLRPHLVPDNSLEAGDCALETNLGSVELGVKAQLIEIERGFFDLLEHREPVRRDELSQFAKTAKA